MIDEDLYDLWIRAVRDDDTLTVKKMLDDGLDVNIVDEHNYTGLMHSIIAHSLNVFRLLIEQPNININKGNNTGFYPIIDACYYCTSESKTGLEMIKLLLDRPELLINVTTNDSECGLIFTANNQRKDAFDILMRHPKIRFDITDIYNQNIFNHKESKRWLRDYDLQKIIITSDNHLIGKFFENNIEFHPTIEKEFNHLISAYELNLL